MACYVYGFVDADRTPPSMAGVQDARVRLMPLGDIAAAVSDIGSDPLGEADAERHLDVLLALLGSGPVLPMRFGMVAPDEESLSAELAQWAEPLRDELARLADLVEVHVTAIDDEQSALAAVVSAQPALAGVNARTPADRIALGERLASLVLERRAALAEELVARLREPTVDDAPRAKLQSAEDPVLRWAFLVRRDGLDEFDTAVTELSQRYPDLELTSVGPLPPFTFVSLDIAAEQSAAPAAEEPDSFSSGNWGW